MCILTTFQELCYILKTVFFGHIRVRNFYNDVSVEFPKTGQQFGGIELAATRYKV